MFYAGVTGSTFAADSIGNAAAINSITIPRILNSLNAAVYNQTLQYVTAYNTVANSHNLDLIAYEGGQHLVAVNNTYLNNTTLTGKLIAANRDPMMESIYCDMLDVWFNNGGKEFFNFSSIYTPNKYGSWGVLENSEQPLSSSYKWKALNACGNTGNAGGCTTTDSTAYTASGNSSYTLPWGQTITQSGTYSNTYQNMNGCDSIVTISVIINSPSDTTNRNIGINIVNPQRNLHINDAMRLEPRNTPLPNPAKGDMYFDGVLNKLRVYDGTTWQNCW